MVLVLGWRFRTRSTAALARLSTTRRILPSDGAELGVRRRLRSACSVTARQWCRRLAITQ